MQEVRTKVSDVMTKKPLTPEEPGIVQVVWRDARFFPSTKTPQEMENLEMALFESVGYLVRQDDITTVLAAEKNNETEFRDVTLIPSGSIQEIRKLLPVQP